MSIANRFAGLKAGSLTGGIFRFPILMFAVG
jgi:hypothetical protein